MHVPPHELYEISTLMDDLYGFFRFWPIQIRILLFASRAVTGDTHFGSGTTGDSMVTKRDLAAFVRQLDILNRVELKQTCLLISRFHTLQHHLEFLSLVPWHFSCRKRTRLHMLDDGLLWRKMDLPLTWSGPARGGDHFNIALHW